MLYHKVSFTPHGEPALELTGVQRIVLGPDNQVAVEVARGASLDQFAASIRRLEASLGLLAVTVASPKIRGAVPMTTPLGSAAIEEVSTRFWGERDEGGYVKFRIASGMSERIPDPEPPPQAADDPDSLPWNEIKHRYGF